MLKMGRDEVELLVIRKYLNISVTVYNIVASARSIDGIYSGKVLLFLFTAVSGRRPRK